ncbi:hypothetical protein DSO57_1026398 [Entomophthora muscae]|uniref:Uncharacterized protein n=1 Tax=Entomophthora muscae TaxID=34485 RepID=A0ACC2TCZ8_9FUNG|nr:hypothetical protein DSO57_1026398 [Entomophthora muscae]
MPSNLQQMGNKLLILSTHEIVNFPSLKTWAQGQDSNPGLDLLWGACPKDQRASCPRFPGIEPPQAEAEDNFLDDNIGQALDTTVPNERSGTLPNGGKEIPTISLIRLKSTLVAN